MCKFYGSTLNEMGLPLYDFRGLGFRKWSFDMKKSQKYHDSKFPTFGFFCTCLTAQNWDIF